MIIATCKLLSLHIIEVAMDSRPGQPLPLLLLLHRETPTPHPSPHQEVTVAAAASRLLLRKKENLFFPKVRLLLGIGCYEVATTTQVSTKESLKGIKDLSFTEAATAIQLACIKLHRKRRRQQQQNCQFSPTVVIL